MLTESWKGGFVRTGIAKACCFVLNAGVNRVQEIPIQTR